MATRNKDYEVDGEPTSEKMWAINEMFRVLYEELFGTNATADEAAETAATAVQGPASSTDNAIARWDGATGQLLQNSGATIDDSGNLTANNFSGSSSGTHSGTSSGTNTGDVTLGGTPDYLTIAGQVITRALINLASHVTGRLPFANLVAATAASKLIGRTDASAGDFQEITLGTNLSMSGTTLNATGGGETHEDGYWSPLTDGDTTQPELIFDSNGDAIMMWVPTP
jgi:uncharacterized protein YukE